MTDMDFLVDEEEEMIEEEQDTNRTFIILVAVLAGLLLVGLCAFGVYMFVIAPRLTSNVAQQNQAIEVTNTAIAMAAGETATADVPPTATEEDTPTPEPSATPTSRPTRTLTPTPAEVAEGEEGDTEEDLMATARPTTTRRPTSTPRATKTSSEKVPSTGIGMFAAGLMGAGLLFLLIVVRRLRHAV